MNQLKEMVNAVLKQQKLHLDPSTYHAQKNNLKYLGEYDDYLGIYVPCQELYDVYVTRAVTPDLRFQLLHAVRLVDKKPEQILFHCKESFIISRVFLPLVNQRKFSKACPFRSVMAGLIQGI
ncbi:hypothetical protein [Blautia sp. 1033sp1_1033st1_G9_1033SCRN_220408]|uniref:hypothetical protein n=1 Tax=Blautia sp. 1033sp1_1033st1_G9_1033SCRN_220408 TaxID=3144490 RepID=UPI0034A12655